MFKQRKNKRFTYKSQLQDSDKSKSKDDFETLWNEANGGNKQRGSALKSLPIQIIILVLIFVLIYILDGYIK
ncbi:MULTISPECIES: hypothetical protein [Winogradskyella]|uniref:hypothetical protein n=1 Tax=Winogradskyella TaxID=286104 RepID=UPI0015C976FC|nr:MULTISPECIES: hypothetical protein [Winogradskyella]QXP79607.1 hypothetical protein H0I32_02900 [Winogradskyella sp. HaHa_3_26]